MKLVYRIALLLCLVLASAAIAKDRSKDVFKKVVRALQDKDVDGAMNALTDLGAQDDEDAAEFLIESLELLEKASYLSDHDANRLYDACVQAMVMLRDPDARQPIFEALEDKKTDEKTKVALIDVLSGYSDESAIDALLKALDARGQSDHVRVNILRAFGTLGDKRPVNRMIDMLEETESRGNTCELWIESKRSLSKITGQDFIYAADWRVWWKEREDTFDPAVDRGDVVESKTVERDAPQFFGNGILGERVCIIIDMSGSMHRREPPAEWEKEAGTESGEPDTPYNNEAGLCEECGQTHPGVFLPEDRMRVNRAKRELIRMIEALAPEIYFNIIHYNHDIIPWEDRLVPATPHNKKSAIRYVERMCHTGLTFTFQALERAFELCPQATAFYLISDGMPTNMKGEHWTPDEINQGLERIRALNRTSRIRINTLGFLGEHKAMMVRLADQNQGKYSEIE